MKFLACNPHGYWGKFSERWLFQTILNFAQIRSFGIPLPPTKDEQQRIADCLSSLDDLITAQTQKIDALKTHKKGLMQQLFPTLDEVDA